MTTLLLTHPVFVEHDTGLGHPERPDRMRAVDKVLAHELFKDLEREEAPLRPGDGGDKFKEAFESRILPALRNFAPDIVLISAGFDAHADDPLANLRLTEPDFAWATAKIAEIAAKHAEGRLVSMLEGGYNLAALARSVGVHVKALMDAGS